MGKITEEERTARKAIGNHFRESERDRLLQQQALQRGRQILAEEALRNSTFSIALQQWGVKNREDKLIEEAGETMQAIMKHRYNPHDGTRLHLIEEVVDLGILVDQLKFIFVHTGQGEDLALLEKQKFEKLQRKLQEGNTS